MVEITEAIASLLWPLSILASVWLICKVARDLLQPGELEADELTKWSIEVPNDIVSYAMIESEEWAREDIIRTAREKYFEHGNWNRVRVAFGLAERD